MHEKTKHRINELRQLLRKRKLSAIIITHPINRNYLSGFTGTESILMVSLKKAFFVTDFRYTEQAKKEVRGFQIVEKKPAESYLETCAKLIRQNRLHQIGFEAEHLPYASYRKLKKYLKRFKLIATASIVESLREIKDKHEIAMISRAAQIAEQAFQQCLSVIRSGKTEREIAIFFETEAKQRGAEKVAFDIIVASGKRAALPHGVASKKRLNQGEIVIFDFGVVYQGYHSDCTRTFILGQPTAKQKTIYELVLKAQETALKFVRVGIACSELDKIARSIIEKEGYSKYFGHGLGHGVGREVHESPRVAQQNKKKLLSGMVITIEPGIYLPNWGGVRIEDLVLITKTGYRLLTAFPKKLIRLPR